MTTIKADLHMHGPIGFQPYWLRKQGYAGRNLLQLIAEECFRKKITICAVTSQRDGEIARFSAEDRLGVLIKHEAPLLPEEYSAGTLGGNNDVLIVEKGNEKVYLVNGQTVMPEEDGQKFDVLIVGTNRIESGRSFERTLRCEDEHQIIKIAEHPYVETHRGMGGERLEKYLDYFDAIEGHNSQARFSSWITKLPLIGSTFSRAGKELNEKAKAIAKEFGKPSVATSDAHRIEDAGISYNEWDGKINDENEEIFFEQLRNKIKIGSFRTVERYEPLIAWLRWVATFQRGVKDKSRFAAEEYIPSNIFVQER